jgi:hypothetical protein
MRLILGMSAALTGKAPSFCGLIETARCKMLHGPQVDVAEASNDHEIRPEATWEL